VSGDEFAGGLERDPGEDVGSHAITQGTLALSSNYALTFVPGTLAITARAITVTVDSLTKVYGEADPALTYQITSGSLAVGDSFTGSLTRDPGEDVGIYAMTQGSLALNSNYTLTVVPGTLEITARSVTVTADPKAKIYGEADPALTFIFTYEFAGTHVTGGDFSGSLSRAAGEDVGSYAIEQGTLTLGGNYVLIFVSAALDITPKALTGSFTAADKVYNGTTAATIATRSLDGILGGDEVSLTGGVASFDTPDVGPGKTVTGTGFTLSGADAGNYSLVSSTLTTTASITPASTDTRAPNTQIVSGRPPKFVIRTTATFTFTGSDNVTAAQDLRFECSLDGGAFNPCTSPLALTGLADGVRAFAVRAIDQAGNVDPTPSTHTWRVDTVAPMLSLPSAMTVPGTRTNGASVPFTATAFDAVSGVETVKCSPKSGSTFRYGTTTVRCEARDDAGNSAVGTFTVTVTYRIRGFFHPIDTGNTVNTVQAGKTVPFRFEVFAGDSEIKTRSVVTSISYTIVPSFPAGSPVDAVEETSSRATALLFAPGEGRFVYYWQTPDLPAGTCLVVTITFRDGTTLSAQLMLT
jgi:hypothetical protein